MTPHAAFTAFAHCAQRFACVFEQLTGSDHLIVITEWMNENKNRENQILMRTICTYSSGERRVCVRAWRFNVTYMF